MKYQFQFAGANVSQTKAQPRKRMRLSVLLVALILATMAYGYYLYRLTHRASPVAPLARAATTIPAAAAAKTVAAPASAAALPSALKQAADAGATAVANLVAKAVKAPVATAPATALPIQPSQPPIAEPQTQIKTQPAQAAPAQPAVPFKIVANPVARRAPRVLTAEEQLTLAAQTAMDRMLTMASKYPDSFGFRPEDALADAKLGQPIPVFTITEQDRAAYQRGQPLKPVLKPAQQWIYPVVANGHVCCMVQVGSNGHEYIPGKANKSLALAWNKINELWPAADGFHPQLVVNPAHPNYYFTVPEAAEPNITDTVQMFYSHPSLSPADVILSSWR
jgi:hypothetical protein